MIKCRAVHKNYDRYDIYIGRGSIWGNYPGEGLPRGLAIQTFERYLLKNEELLAQLPDLIGLELGCYCHRRDDPKKAKRCHGDVLAKYTNRIGHPFFKSWTKRIMHLHEQHKLKHHD